MLAVLSALFANGIIAILKFAAAVITGSSGMMAEALHSVADTTNQVFLLLGLRFYKRPASEKHPFGYGNERFFWSFIAAIFYFRRGSDVCDLRRHRKTQTSSCAGTFGMGLLGTGHLVRFGSRLNRPGDLPGGEGSAPLGPDVLCISS
jgi:hypothetical protein